MTAAERVDEIRARLAASTPGQWSNDGSNVSAYSFPDDHDSTYVGYLDVHDDDVELLVHAPADIAWLLEQLNEANARAANFERMVDDVVASRMLAEMDGGR